MLYMVMILLWSAAVYAQNCDGCLPETGDILLQEKRSVAATSETRKLASCFDLGCLGFGGTGSKHEGEHGVTYLFSSGFQKQICSKCSSTHCWGAQGISNYGDFITRSFYEKGKGDECKNPSAKYYAITVMNKHTAKYSNILVRNGEKDPNECHAGDHVLHKAVDGTFWFFVACTYHISIFSAESITSCTDASTCTVNNKRFNFFVEGGNVANVDISLKTSYISRAYGTLNEFWVGAYSKKTDGLNLQRISLQQSEGSWSLDYLDGSSKLEVNSAYSDKVQGATVIGNDMFLTTSDYIRRCSWEKKSTGARFLSNCREQCMLPCSKKFKEIAQHSFDYGFDYCKEKIVLQGSETDEDGNLYVASEFDGAHKPFFVLHDLTTTFKDAKGKRCVEPAPPYSPYSHSPFMR